MCPKQLGCKIIAWYLLAALLGIAASLALNFVLLDQEYATSPANQWLLIGGVTSTSITFRIRLADDGGSPLVSPDDSRLVIAQDKDFQQTVLQYSLVRDEGSEFPGSSDEYGIHALTVPNLSPQRVYFYGIISSTHPGGILKGTFQTPAPEGTAFNFTIAAGACSWTGSKKPIFDQIREDHPNLQLFVHLGDFHYEDINSNDMVERLDAVSTVLNSDPQADLFRSVPLVLTWDDHDYVGDEVPGETASTQARDTAR